MVTITMEQGPKAHAPVERDPVYLTNTDRPKGNPKDEFHIDTETDPDNLVLTVGGRAVKLPFFPKKDEPVYVDNDFGPAEYFSRSMLQERLGKIAADPQLRARMDEKRLRQKLRLRNRRYSPYTSKPVTSGNASVNNMAVESEQSQLMVESFPPVSKLTRSAKHRTTVGVSNTQHIDKRTKLNAVKFQPIQPRLDDNGDTPQYYLASLPTRMNPPSNGVMYPFPAGFVNLGPATRNPGIRREMVCHVGTTRHRFVQTSTTTDKKSSVPVFGTGVHQSPVTSVHPTGIPRAETVIPVPAAGTPVSQDISHELVMPTMVAPPADTVTPSLVKNVSVPQQLPSRPSSALPSATVRS
ncbi:hypothetical protein F53441_1784 [Fusarium austroafricanum]|uniref:Uncharacterized protein n=1 Tax=Fusarium austroafricanum TaxID=2364996 RepID=A0A8H4P3N8_9HYPO|nr:hypothetical protein F53441_1784 [Fusarium austroafricanum]